MVEEGSSLDILIRKIMSYNPYADFSLLIRAYNFAEKAHFDQYCKSGDFFIEHLLGVANILADLQMDISTIAAGILHDVVEDTSVRVQHIRDTFGEEISQLVEGVTKLDSLNFSSKEEEQAANLRKLFIYMAKDIRVVLIKIADRLHNMRTLSYLSEERQKEFSRETLEIFAPLAHRLGMAQIKWELEDLSFRYLDPEKYRELANLVQKKRKEREEQVKKIIQVLEDRLRKAKINAEVTGRPKHLYSIYQKMLKYKKSFKEIYDLTAIRVITESKEKCYEVLGIVHSLWKPIPGMFDDYIATPKSNNYQSIHTTVLDEKGDPIEVQIRDRKMHEVAEYGIAAHWRYKENIKTIDEFEEKMGILRQLLETQKEYPDPKEFLDNIKRELFEDEVFVFTPKGDLIKLPLHSTPVDFAYRIHTEIGNHCVGAKVNNRIVPLNYQLQNGDIVEIITSKEAKPSRDWLNFVRSAHTRSKIKHYFRAQNREQSILEGKEAIEKEIRRKGLDETLLSEEYLTRIAEKMHLRNSSDLLSLVGYGDISAQSVANKLEEIFKQEKISKEVPRILIPKEQTVKRRIAKAGQGVIVEGMNNILVRFSKCCSPLPGEEIVGYITKGKGVTIHCKDCPNIPNLDINHYRFVNVEWDNSSEIYCPVDIEITALDRVGLLNEITSVISSLGVNLSSLRMTTPKGKTRIIISMEINDVEKLNQIIRKIKEIKEVFSVKRISLKAEEYESSPAKS